MARNKENVLEDISENITEKKYLVINKNNFPYDLHIGNKFFRLEPRDKTGDRITIGEELKNHKDFETVKNKIIIQEAKI